jgi:hypothetical protein
MAIRLSVETSAARALGGLSRIAGRGGGTTIPGKVLWKLDPGAVDQLAARLPHGIAVMSATNGKTTTTAMAAEILGATPRSPGTARARTCSRDRVGARRLAQGGSRAVRGRRGALPEACARSGHAS